MKNIIKNILKEEHDNIKLKNFIYNYINKKVSEGKWKGINIQNHDCLYDGFYIVDAKDNLVYFAYIKPTNEVIVYDALLNLFINKFKIRFHEFDYIIMSFIKDRLKKNPKKISAELFNCEI